MVELYEARDTSDDLDGTKRVAGCAGPGGMIELSGRVENTDDGGDWGDHQIDVLSA